MFYNNCGGYRVVSSEGSSQLEMNSCEKARYQKFQETFYSFFTTKNPNTRRQTAPCASCHFSGGPDGANNAPFSDINVFLSYESFLKVGVFQIKRKASDPNHAPGNTGPEHSVQLSDLETQWNMADSDFQKCSATLPQVSPPASGGGRISPPPPPPPSLGPSPLPVPSQPAMVNCNQNIENGFQRTWLNFMATNNPAVKSNPTVDPNSAYARTPCAACHSENTNALSTIDGLMKNPSQFPAGNLYFADPRLQNIPRSLIHFLYWRRNNQNFVTKTNSTAHTRDSSGQPTHNGVYPAGTAQAIENAWVIEYQAYLQCKAVNGGSY